MFIRLEWRAEGDADRSESQPVADFRPGVEGTVNCHGDHPNAQSMREVGRSFFEALQLSVAPQRALGKDDEVLSGLQPDGADPHGAPHISVGVHRHYPKEPRDHILKTAAEERREAERKKIANDTVRQYSGDQRAIQITLMVRANQKRAFPGQMLKAANLQSEKNFGEQKS